MARPDLLQAALAQQSHKPEARIDVNATSRSEDLASPSVASVPDNASSLPVIDLTAFLRGDSSSSEVRQISLQVADCLHQTGCLIVKDPRVGVDDSETFLDMVARYFAQSFEAKLADCRPSLHYQASTQLSSLALQLHECLRDNVMARPRETGGSLCPTIAVSMSSTYVRFVCLPSTASCDDRSGALLRVWSYPSV